MNTETYVIIALAIVLIFKTGWDRANKIHYKEQQARSKRAFQKLKEHHVSRMAALQDIALKAVDELASACESEISDIQSDLTVIEVERRLWQEKCKSAEKDYRAAKELSESLMKQLEGVNIKLDKSEILEFSH